MSAPDRANDSRRVPSPAGGYYEDDMAQRRFAAHGFNKGKASDIAKNVWNNAQASVDATGGLARSNRRQHRSNLRVRGTVTASQEEKSIN